MTTYEVQVQWQVLPNVWATVRTTHDVEESLISYEYYRDWEPTARNVQIVKHTTSVIREVSK